MAHPVLSWHTMSSSPIQAENEICTCQITFNQLEHVTTCMFSKKIITAVLMPRLYIHVKARPIRVTSDDHDMRDGGERGYLVAVLGLHGCYRVYVPIFLWTFPCGALTGQIYVKLRPWHKESFFFLFSTQGGRTVIELISGLTSMPEIPYSNPICCISALR